MVDEALVEHILRAVELVPAGRVATYGDIAAIVGIGPRHVGNVVARWGHGVPWWRVTNSRGELPVSLLEQARARWETENIPAQSNGTCRLRDCRADLSSLEQEWTRSITDVPC